ncbi:MAG: AI-2E family transporter [Chloroflexi bacterium]|nr:AI-2E family transporter [Chloroflexota bacterium]
MANMTESQPPSSPHWSSTAKLVVALSAAGIIGALIFRFQNILAPLLMAFLIAYIFHPLASFLSRHLKISWRVVSTLIFLVLLLSILGLLTWGGISIVEQVQNLVSYLQGLIGDLPSFFASISSSPLRIGPFTIDLSRLDLNSLWTQLQGVVQPALSNIGTLIGSIASGAASTITWVVFILLIAYFIMAESNGVREGMFKLAIPNYQEDFARLGKQLSLIWNAFLRGQLFVFAITVIFYSFLLGSLGVRYFFLLAFLAGLARFVPYVGPFVAWTTYALVALFQTNYLNLLPLPYALIVVGCALVTDTVMDNYVSPRIMSDALKVHPAAVLVMVFISASLFGFIGVLLSAPVLASIKLISNYIIRKLMDLDPWLGLDTFPRPEPIKKTFTRIRKKINQWMTKHSKNEEKGKP